MTSMISGMLTAGLMMVFMFIAGLLFILLINMFM